MNSQTQLKDEANKTEKPNKKKYSTKKVTSQAKSTFAKLRKSKALRKETDEELVSEEEKPKKFDDFELNELEYEEAVKYDQRSCCRMYYFLIKREHRIIFTFLVYSDYNLVPVKWSRFIFLLATV